MAAAGTSRPDYVRPKMSGPIMKQPTFDWSSKDKYAELRNFKLEIGNMLQNFNLGPKERVLVIKNWPGREGPQLIAILTQEEQEDEKGLFETLNKNLSHNTMEE